MQKQNFSQGGFMPKNRQYYRKVKYPDKVTKPKCLVFVRIFLFCSVGIKIQYFPTAPFKVYGYIKLSSLHYRICRIVCLVCRNWLLYSILLNRTLICRIVVNCNRCVHLGVVIYPSRITCTES